MSKNCEDDPLDGLTAVEITAIMNDVSIEEAEKYHAMKSTQELINEKYVEMVLEVWIEPRVEAFDVEWLYDEGVEWLSLCGFRDGKRIIDKWVEREMSSG